MLRSDGHGLDQAALESLRKNSRYYAISNGLRLVLFGLLFPDLLNGPTLGLVVASTLGFLHLLLCLVESFRLSNFLHVEPEAIRSLRIIAASRAPKAWSLARWESERLYRFLGMERVRRTVLAYQRWAMKGEPDGIQGRGGFQDFAATCTQAGLLHSALIVFDGVVFVSLLVTGSPWVWLMALMLVVHLLLVLLQRYHLSRIQRVLVPTSEKSCRS